MTKKDKHNYPLNGIYLYTVTLTKNLKAKC